MPATAVSRFNADLFAAEHLAIEDEASSTDLRTRRHFGAMLKNLIVNETQSCHGKGRQALTLKPFWRVTISLNDEAENLMVLPPLDESLQDKIMLLRAQYFQWPMPVETLEQRQRFSRALRESAPDYLVWLSKNWEMPAACKNPNDEFRRYGVATHHDSVLLSALNSLSPEMKLRDLISTCVSIKKSIAENGAWEGRSADLERQLRAEHGYEAERLLSFNTACAVYLARLASKFPNEFRKERGENNTGLWVIKGDLPLP